MTASELLRETQTAAGNEKLKDWHDTLIESGKTLRKVQEVGIRLHQHHPFSLRLIQANNNDFRA
jgi:hypothetical protein